MRWTIVLFLIETSICFNQKQIVRGEQIKIFLYNAIKSYSGGISREWSLILRHRVVLGILRIRAVSPL